MNAHCSLCLSDSCRCLWRRALTAHYAQVEREDSKRRSTGVRAGLERARLRGAVGQGNRRYPHPKVGDTYGCYEVAAILPRDARSFERVRLRCSCGHESDTTVHSARKRTDRCPHVSSVACPIVTKTCGRPCGRPATRRDQDGNPVCLQHKGWLRRQQSA